MAPTESKTVHVLLIEDNPADVELLRMALDQARFPYEVTVIHDGAEALELFRKTADLLPDITVLDLNLPKYGGLEILEAARANPAYAGMPIAILSSSSSPRERSRIQMFDKVRYLTKPLDLDEYLSIGPIIRDFAKPS